MGSDSTPLSGCDHEWKSETRPAASCVKCGEYRDRIVIGNPGGMSVAVSTPLTEELQAAKEASAVLADWADEAGIEPGVDVDAQRAVIVSALEQAADALAVSEARVAEVEKERDWAVEQLKESARPVVEAGLERVKLSELTAAEARVASLEEALERDADTFAGLVVFLTLLRHETAAEACRIAETSARAVLAAGVVTNGET